MNTNKILVTGGAGFIGCNLVEHFLKRGIEIVVVDNFTTGKRGNLTPNVDKLHVIEHELLDPLPDSVFDGVDMIIHLAANADIRDGMNHSHKDIEQNIVVTERLLNQSVANGIKNFVFASTAAVLGEPDIFPTPETLPLPRQTSLYGMSKLAAEGVFSAYAEAYALRVSAFRFVSVVGPHYSHGHIIDFVRKLRKNPYELEILGDGKQRKSYLHISDILAGIDCVINKLYKPDTSFFEAFHIGNTEYCTVEESANVICSELDLSPRYRFTGGERGWVGDSPFVHLETKKLAQLGWYPKVHIFDAIRETARWLKDNMQNSD